MSFTKSRLIQAIVVCVPVLQGWAAETPSPALIVLNKADQAVAIVDPATGNVVARVRVGEGPHEVAVSANGRFAFVGNYGQQMPGNTISVIDLPAQAELQRVDVSPLQRPHGMLFVAGKVYFTAEMNRLIARFDPAANKVDWMLGTGQATTHMLVANADASLIFTANIGSNSVSVIERIAWQVGGTRR